jgi:branched-chain amino acid aminotransferase
MRGKCQIEKPLQDLARRGAILYGKGVHPPSRKEQLMAEAKYILFDGQAVPYADARVHVLAPAIAYAAMVFEGIRGYWNDEHGQMYLFRLDEHLQRLRQSMRVMRYGVEYGLDALREQAIEAVRVNDLRETIHMRAMAMLTGTPPDITSRAPASLVITAGAYPRKTWWDTGMAVEVSSWQRVHESSNPPRVKASANYSNGRLAMLQAQENGYDGTIMLTREGRVSEAPVATVFMHRRGKLVTPSITEGILESVTRDTLIELARDELGLPVEERPVDRTELYSADELFFCGSGWEITPISSVDRIPVGGGKPGPLTRRVSDAYHDVTHGRNARYAHWLTPVYPD